MFHFVIIQFASSTWFSPAKTQIRIHNFETDLINTCWEYVRIKNFFVEIQKLIISTCKLPRVNWILYLMNVFTMVSWVENIGEVILAPSNELKFRNGKIYMSLLIRHNACFFERIESDYCHLVTWKSIIYRQQRHFSFSQLCRCLWHDSVLINFTMLGEHTDS